MRASALTIFATLALALPAAAVPPSPRVATPRERLLLKPDAEVDASESLDELLDELAHDVGALSAAQVSPLLVDRVRVSDNLDPSYATVFYSRLVAALQRSGRVAVQKCLECQTTQGRVSSGEWIVTRGITRREDLRRVAQDYGAKAFLSAMLTLQEDPDSLALDVELLRADDQVVVFAETYRVDPQKAMLYRGSDTTFSRQEKMRDLEDRLYERARFGHGAYFGAMLIPDEDPRGPILGGFGQYRLYERFGVERQHRVALSIGGFIHSSRLAGGVIGATVLTRVTGENLYGPQLYLGVTAGGFLTGGGGNTWLGSAHVEYMLGQRLAVQLSVAWIHPFDLARKGHMVGGVSPQAGMAFIW